MLVALPYRLRHIVYNPSLAAKRLTNRVFGSAFQKQKGLVIPPYATSEPLPRIEQPKTEKQNSTVLRRPVFPKRSKLT